MFITNALSEHSLSKNNSYLTEEAKYLLRSEQLTFGVEHNDEELQAKIHESGEFKMMKRWLPISR